MRSIQTAPKNKVIRIINKEHGIQHQMIWSKKMKRWEGKYLGVLGVVNVYWDTDDEIQPTHWEEIK